MSIILSSKRLKVKVEKPGEFPNTTTRFDRAGFITQVTLDGKYDFCTEEPEGLRHRRTGGMGLCSEFQLEQAAEDAQIGTNFPKPGVGLLLKEEEGKYVFHYPYKCEPYEVDYDAEDNSITFETAPLLCMGYAFRHVKKISVEENALIMEITFENTGEKAINFNEYCHNFLSIEYLPIGPDYYLDMTVSPQDGKAAMRGPSVGSGNGFTYTDYSDSATMITVAGEEIPDTLPFTWKLTNKKSTAWVSEEVSAKPSKVAVWSIDHIVSPEVICSFSLNPGEKATWSRKWTFGC